MISLTPVLKESRSGTRTRSAGILFQRTMDIGKRSIFSNRHGCESVCKKESACGECILQDAQNMAEVVWQLGRKRSCKT